MQHLVLMAMLLYCHLYHSFPINLSRAVHTMEIRLLLLQVPVKQFQHHVQALCSRHETFGEVSVRFGQVHSLPTECPDAAVLRTARTSFLHHPGSNGNDFYTNGFV